MSSHHHRFTLPPSLAFGLSPLHRLPLLPLHREHAVCPGAPPRHRRRRGNTSGYINPPRWFETQEDKRTRRLAAARHGGR
ncbi:putative phosphatidylinositol 4-phosphate 3-kinase C2 domain-containing [Sesbania bispinosa]|nr:putative phosphatidylinositol 4-phosphate 3-kinase C2 domain-containing [Sesbania bispinosa]